MQREILDTDQKTLTINLDERIYGTFSEIGAGQEVARHFFKVGAAAGTIAKTMSAYDKSYSDAIYGAEPSARYVCESRLYKMLDHEYQLIDERLEHKSDHTTFFVFADTVAAINYSRTISGNGWLGIRFQTRPNGPANDLVIHVKMLDNDYQLQQSAIGILGVNLIYACFYFNDNPDFLVDSLMDALHGRIVIDMIRLTGPDFTEVDNRLLSMLLVKYNLSEVAIFGPDGKSMHASEFLYKKSVMVVRGNYRPPTLVSMDVFEASYKQFKQEEEVVAEKSILLAELTLDNLMLNGQIDYSDFLDRAEALCTLGQTVIVSNCSNHQKLINYLSDYKIRNLGLVIGVRELIDIINQKYYQNLDGRLLVAFGELFTRNIKIYAYPILSEENGLVLTGSNLPVPEGIKFLYQYLLESEHIVEVKNYNADLLKIYPQKVLRLIHEGKHEEWSELVPIELAERIKSKKLFANSFIPNVSESEIS